MRIHHWLVVAAASIVLAAPATAQSLKKVGANVHRVLKKTGRDVKEAGGEVGSATHKTLQKAGNDSKNELKRTTGGVKIRGDVGKAANGVSKSSKKVGRSAKKGLKSSSSKAHQELTKTGKDAKEAVKP